jgi:hypothetical protein
LVQVLIFPSVQEPCSCCGAFRTFIQSRQLPWLTLLLLLLLLVPLLDLVQVLTAQQVQKPCSCCGGWRTSG